MDYRPLGRSGLLASVIGFGAAVLNRDDSDGRREADAKVGFALDAGVNLFDTADVYADGVSERLLGRSLGHRRDEVILSSKVRFRSGPHLNDEGLSRRHIARSLEASLQRLGTDHIDLYHLHEWDGQTPVEETVAALDLAVRAGKIRYVGVSNFAGWQLGTFLAEAAGCGLPIVAQQIHYSPVCRDAEYELVPLALVHQQALLVWSPLAGGLLGGRYDRSHTDQVAAWSEPPVPDPNRFFGLLDLLRTIGDELAAPLARVALAWTSQRVGVTTLIVGGRTLDQLQSLLTGPMPDLDNEQLARIDRFTRPALLYPYWHQRSVASRLSPVDLNLLGPHLSPDQS